jgi:hypothetical protein
VRKVFDLCSTLVKADCLLSCDASISEDFLDMLLIRTIGFWMIEIGELVMLKRFFAHRGYWLSGSMSIFVKSTDSERFCLLVRLNRFATNSASFVISVLFLHC